MTKRFPQYHSEEQHATDLHDLLIPNADGPARKLQDYSSSFDNVKVDVYFRDLQTRLVELISEADIVLGSVAWLTSFPILDALAKTYSSHIVVQKEDFLRPDTNSGSDWNRKLHEKYNAIPSRITRDHPSLSGTALYNMSYLGDPAIQSARCVGNYNREKAAASPRAHNKFIIFCKKTIDFPGASPIEIRFSPYAVWTGSFNFTTNATRSFENAILMHGKDIAMPFFREWAQISALSEPLNWGYDWVAPEHRIGS